MASRSSALRAPLLDPDDNDDCDEAALAPPAAALLECQRDEREEREELAENEHVLDEASRRFLASEDEEAQKPLARGALAPGYDFGDSRPVGDDDDGRAAPAQLPDAYGRWVVLGLYCYISALQSLLWMTYSSVPDVSRAYLGIDDATLDLFLDWGPAAFLVSVFAAGHLLSASRSGLASSIRIGASMCFVASILRCVPVIFSTDSLQQKKDALVGITHFCQFLNGAAAPFVVASPALLSLAWFPEGQRNSATALANVASALGRGIGFFLGPAIAPNVGDMPMLLVLEVGLAIIPLVLAFWLLPNSPLSPPSRAAREEDRRWNRIERERRRKTRRDEVADAAANAAAVAAVSASGYDFGSRVAGEELAALARQTSEEEAEDDAEEEAEEAEADAIEAAEASETAAAARAAARSCASINDAGAGAVVVRAPPPMTHEQWLQRRQAQQAAAAGASLWSELRLAVATPSFALLCVAGGLEMAVYGMWSGVLPAVLTSLPGSSAYTDVQAGAFGSVNTFAGIGGGLLAGVLTDAPWLRRHLVPVSGLLLVAGAFLFGLIAFTLPPLGLSGFATLAASYPLLLALCALAGLVRGGADPLFFELAAESVASRGVSAGTSGAVLTFVYHLILVCLLALSPDTLALVTLPGMAFCLAVAALLLVPVRVEYTRR